MRQFYKIIIYDYLQRTRSYAFLLTLAISLYAAYSFVPARGANYTTLRIGSYVGVQNAAWIGYVTAMMSSVFISMIGFYLVNSNIKKDMNTGVGMIIATTQVSNLSYLLSKAWSNFLVLLSITGMVVLMAIVLVFIRSASYPFEIFQFVLPYLLITIPAIVFIAFLAVVAEVFFHRFTILMNIGYYVLFCLLIALQQNTNTPIDLFGFKQVTAAMQDIVVNQYHPVNQAVSMGFIIGHKNNYNTFVFDGIHWTALAILSRLVLIGLGFLMVLISSRFFHRFDVKEKFRKQKKTKLSAIIPQVKPSRDIKLSELPPIMPSFGIIPFIKTELLMLIRKGPRWLWIINLGGMISLVVAPLAIAHQIILPCLWFLQVARWSDLATKEKTNRIHYFTYASYKPLTRLLPAQVIAGVILSIALASPLLIRCLITMHFLSVISILSGAILIVLLAVTLGMLSGGKKLFEIIFFLFTYANINRIPFIDYFGGENQGPNYLVYLFAIISILACMSFLIRKFEIRRL